MMHNLAAVPVFLGLPAAAFTCRRQRAGPATADSAGTALPPQRPCWQPRHWPGQGANQSPRLVNLAGLFQRASIVTGFGWLTALSAQALTRAPAASARKPST